jgi:hypothetical protein
MCYPALRISRRTCVSSLTHTFTVSIAASGTPTKRRNSGAEIAISVENRLCQSNECNGDVTTVKESAPI